MPFLLFFLVLPVQAEQPSYLALPPQARPLNNLLPKGGILKDPAALRISSQGVFQTAQVDFQNREVAVTSWYYNMLSKDSSRVWSYYYQELATYTFDMFDIGFRRLWLNSLIGQKDGGSGAQEGSLFDISIPVNMPGWMKDFGLDKPKLMLQGQMDIRLQGRGETDDAPGSNKNSLWPSPNLSYDPQFSVKGKIGRNITVEINNAENGLGARDQLRVVYAESTPGEFEDYVLQRVELGSTSLALDGTELTGYSENHRGLFGVKAEFKLGDLWLTTIASQEGGQQQEYKLRSDGESSEFQVQDKQFVSYKWFFLNQEYRNRYIQTGLNGRNSEVAPPSDLKIYKRALSNQQLDVLTNITAVYDPQGTPYRKTGLRLVQLSSDEWSWDRRTGAIRVDGVSRGTLLAASWNGDGTARKSSSVSSGNEVLLFKDDAQSGNTGLEQLMLRNVYSIGLSASNRSSFVLRMKDKGGGSGDFLYKLGVADSATGVVQVDDADVFPRGTSGDPTGELWLPCQPTSWYVNHGYADAQTRAQRNCLEPLRILDTASSTFDPLYSTPVYNLNRVESKYYFESVGKRRRSSIDIRSPGSSYSVNSGGCLDIAVGSEKLKAGSEVLVRDVDYQVNYELGQIELISSKALDPNREITVTYECEPLFEIQNKVLLGARAQLPLRKFGEGSLIGATLLYKSQTTTQSQPRFGGEPYNSVLWGANIRLTDKARWMDRLVNGIPLIETSAPSRWSLEAEIAQSRHDPNTSDRGEALLDDFESSGRYYQYSLWRTSWYPASPPGGVESDASTWIPDLDYRHLGNFVWHSNVVERNRYIYPETGDPDNDNREVTVLEMSLRPNDNLEGRSWGGVMRSNPQYFQDMSTMRYLEAVVRGNVGSIFVDIGAISEDVPVSGYEPNGELNSEAQAGTTTPLNDWGLDGVTQSDERRQVWDCRTAECASQEILPTGANTDVAGDNFKEQEDETDPDSHINGTEGNAGERSFDTEDLDRNGSLDLENRFVRYRIDLEDDDPLRWETLKGGWRRVRIPLEEVDSIISSDGAKASEILADARYTRLWLGRLRRGVAEAQVQIADLRIVGNQWEEAVVSSDYEVRSGDVDQVVDVDGSQVVVSSPGQIVVPDTNWLRVSVINNRDNAGSYYKSPNTVTERDEETSAALKEQALVLDFGALHPEQEVSATRFFDTDSKDLTQYSLMKMEIHLQSEFDTVPVRFAVQLGYGGLTGSSDYYEWSFRPSAYQCNSGERVKDCHDRNWRANAFSLPLKEWTNLKSGRKPPYLAPVEKALQGVIAEARDERIKLVGNPSLSKVNWIRFVIIADDGIQEGEAKGTFWINDLRLAGTETRVGMAGRLHGQMDFGDVMSVSADLKYRDGDFATLRSDGNSPLQSLSNSATRLDVGGNYSFQMQKFFPDSWGMRLPLGLGYTSVVERPYLKPTSDQPLTHDDYADLLPEFSRGDLAVTDSAEEEILRDGAVPESKGYQSYSRTRTLSMGFAKDYHKDEGTLSEILSQTLAERPSINYSYRETETRSATAADSSYTYSTTLGYKLGTFNRFQLRPVKKWNALTFEPWPQTFDLTVAELTYERRVNQERDPDFVSPQVPRVLDYTVDLTHGAKINWNILPILNASYNLNIKRDMAAGGDQPWFTKESMLYGRDGGTFLAVDRVFDYDHTDHKVYVSVDSVARFEIGRRPRVTANGDTITVIPGDTTTYVPVYDSTLFYRVDSVGSREYGRSYGILRNERNREQDFRLAFTPELAPFLPTRWTFASTFRQAKTLPENFDAYDAEQIDENFWSVAQTNRFEFAPTLRLIRFAEVFGKKNAMSRGLEKLRWRELRATWNVNLDTKGEDFTLSQLFDEQGVTPAQYYLYGLGFGDGYGPRNAWDIVTGDMNLTRPGDFESFGEYRNQNVDTLVYRGPFLHGVKRAATIGTGLTLPWWDIGVSGDMSWAQEFEQPRENPLYLDTTLTWPAWSVGITVPNFANRLAFTKGHLRSLTASHRTSYSYVYGSRPAQAAEDSWQDTWDWSPLLKLSALTPRGIRIDNAVNWKLDHTLRRPKTQVVTDIAWPNETIATSDTSVYWFSEPWMYTSRYDDYSWTLGDELAIGYDLKTKRGFQLWRWYVRLDNDVRLNLASGYSFQKTRRDAREVIGGYEPLLESTATDGVDHYIRLGGSGSCSQVTEECRAVYAPRLGEEETIIPIRHYETYIRPSAGYQFNQMAEASAYIEYRRITEKLDAGEEHTQQILQFEIRLLLQFR